ALLCAVFAVGSAVLNGAVTAWGQVPLGPISAGVPSGAPAFVQLGNEPYAPVLGAQPRVPPPTTLAEAPPVLPPPPSQSHLPALLPALETPATGPTFDLHPSLTLSEQYSDNFLLTSTNHIDNFRTLLTPGLLVGINGAKVRGTVAA